MRLLAVGDIQGCRRTLERLINQVRPSEEEHMVFLGDYIDRGPDSKGVIDFLIEFGRVYPETAFLRGNHEQMMLEAWYHCGRSAEIRKMLNTWDWVSLYQASKEYSCCLGGQKHAEAAWINNGGFPTLEGYDPSPRLKNICSF